MSDELDDYFLEKDEDFFLEQKALEEEALQKGGNDNG